MKKIISLQVVMLMGLAVGLPSLMQANEKSTERSECGEKKITQSRIWQRNDERDRNFFA